MVNFFCYLGERLRGKLQNKLEEKPRKGVEEGKSNSPKWYGPLALFLLIAFVNTSQAANSPAFSALASGTTNSLTLSVTVEVADADIGKTGNYYLAFSLNGFWYFNNGSDWVEYNAGVLPVFATGPLFSGTAGLVENVDLTGVIGARLYVGYGLTESDMVANEKYSLVYTVTQDAQPIGPAAVRLGSSGDFAVLAKTGVSTVPPSVIIGDVGVSPAATSFLTGFSLTAVGTTSATSPQVTGDLFGGDMTTPTDSNLTTAVLNMEAAYTDAAGRPNPDQLNLGDGNIGGLMLAGGLYSWSSSVTVASDFALSGGANDVWIFQITGDLSISASTQVTLSGGAQAKNLFWQVAGEVTIGAGADFKGNILSQTAITMQTGSTLNGRALAQSAVVLDSAIITKPAP